EGCEGLAQTCLKPAGRTECGQEAGGEWICQRCDEGQPVIERRIERGGRRETVLVYAVSVHSLRHEINAVAGANHCVRPHLPRQADTGGKIPAGRIPELTRLSANSCKPDSTVHLELRGWHLRNRTPCVVGHHLRGDGTRRCEVEVSHGPVEA